MIRFTGSIPQGMLQSRWTVPQILNDWSKYNMKMKEIQKVYLKNSRMSSSENNIAVLTSAKWEYA